MENFAKGIELEGTIEAIIYHNKDNGFTVFSLMHSEEETTCTGYITDPGEGETIKVEGNYVNNPRYGRQLSITSSERVRPSSAADIEKYLASGVIKGIGAKTARNIVAKFGEQTFEILENFPEKIAEVRGINMKRAMQIAEIFLAQSDQRRAMLFLQKYGITPAFAMKIYKRYKEDTVETVKSNPYKLADDIDGIGFKTADAIAYNLGISRESPYRISAGVRYQLWEATNEGHTYMLASRLISQSAELLYTETSIIENELVRMQMERSIVREMPQGETEPLVFATPLYHAEAAVARKLTLLDSAYSSQSPPKLEIKNSEITLSEGQKNAVALALTQGVLIITGGPGTGKTTTINTIIGLLESKDLNIILSAPTGRAAKRMTEATGREAKTLHRLLEVSFISDNSRRQVFNKNEDNPIEADVIIVDEASMMDILLTHSLLKAVAVGTRLILVGDVDQLPSVGPGNVLKDIIDSKAISTARLTEIFRQAATSAIITNAHLINKGEYPEINDKEKDFFFLKRENSENLAATILDLVSNRLPAYKKLDPTADIQVLSPTRKSPLGVNHLNSLLQSKLNPADPHKREREYGSTIFREGDKVMQIRNNYDITWEIQNENGKTLDFGEGVFNGDMGVIKKIDHDIGLTVIFDDVRSVTYDFAQLDELELAYAVTVHKSQGSEYRVVVIPIFNGPPMLLTRNLLYTAVTRAKELAVLVGNPETLYRMVDNNKVTRRYTALSRRLKDIMGEEK